MSTSSRRELLWSLEHDDTFASVTRIRLTFISARDDMGAVVANSSTSSGRVTAAALKPHVEGNDEEDHKVARLSITPTTVAAATTMASGILSIKKEAVEDGNDGEQHPPLLTGGGSATLSAAAVAQVHYTWSSTRRVREHAYQKWVRRDILGAVRTPVRRAKLPALSLCHSIAAASPSLPQSIACVLHIPLLSQYEKLLCPSLLSSPLYSPVVEEEEDDEEVGTSSHNTTGEGNQSAKPAAGYGDGSPRPPKATCRLITRVARVAIDLSIPIQEAAFFLSLSLLYIDLLMADVAAVSTTATSHAAAAAAAPADDREGAQKTAEDSSPPQQRRRVEVYDGRGVSAPAAAPPKGCDGHGSSLRLEEGDTPADVLRRLKESWVLACPDRDAFLKQQPPTVATSSTGGEDTTAAAVTAPQEYSLDPRYYRRHRFPLRPSAATVILLLMAAEEWEQRQAFTTTFSSHSSSTRCCHATAWAPRELSSLSSSSGSSGSPSSSATAVMTSTSSNAPLFSPLMPRHTSRRAHHFRLPPLPPDPLELFFKPVWARVVQCCLSPGQSGGGLLSARECSLREATNQWRPIHRYDIKTEAKSRQLRQEEEAAAAAAAASSEQKEPLKLWERTRDSDGTLYGVGLSSTSFSIRCPVEVEWQPHPANASSSTTDDRHNVSQYGHRAKGHTSGALCSLACSGAAAVLMEYGLPRHTPVAVIQRTATSTFTDIIFSSKWAARIGRGFGSVEEAADAISCAGVPLRRGANGGAGVGSAAGCVKLTHAQQGSLRMVLEKHLPELLLTCLSGGFVECRVRGTSRASILLYLSLSGKESKIGIPSTIASVSPLLYPSASTASSSLSKQKKAREVLARALSLVWRGSLQEAHAFLQILTQVRQADPTAADRLRLRRKLASSSAMAGTRWQEWVVDVAAAAAPPPVTVGESLSKSEGDEEPPTATCSLPLPQQRRYADEVEEVDVLVLHRSEESALGNVLLSHPCQLLLIGCGIQQILLRAADGRLLLRRTCGSVAEWALEDCYHSATGQLLPRPQLRTEPEPLPLPMELAPLNPPLVVTREYVSRLLQHYFTALFTTKSSSPVEAAGEEEEDSDESRRQEAGEGGMQLHRKASTVLLHEDRVIMMYVLRHHPRFFVRQGCGIEEVRVSWEWAAAAVSNDDHSENESSSGAAVAATSSTTGKRKVPVLLVEHSCGRQSSWSSLLPQCFQASPPHGLMGWTRVVERS